MVGGINTVGSITGMSIRFVKLSGDRIDATITGLGRQGNRCVRELTGR